MKRCQQGLPQAYWLNAACVGDTPKLKITLIKPLLIKAKGWGNRRLCRINKYGFPCSEPPQIYRHGWYTGDLARAVIPKGKNVGVWTGLVVVQGENPFEFRIGKRRIHRTLDKFILVQARDGYSYSYG
ncbi:MAG: hypothetical protein F6K58_11320 [Symploca sp. SIO2E9]|nr:hypothetical protein [Symploca sp. SIO2E9]